MRNSGNINIILDSIFIGNESVEVMETVLFTNLIEKEAKQKPFLSNYQKLNYLAEQNKYDAMFSPFFMLGSPEDLQKTRNLLIKSIKCN